MSGFGGSGFGGSGFGGASGGSSGFGGSGAASGSGFGGAAKSDSGFGGSGGKAASSGGGFGGSGSGFGGAGAGKAPSSGFGGSGGSSGFGGSGGGSGFGGSGGGSGFGGSGGGSGFGGSGGSSGFGGSGGGSGFGGSGGGAFGGSGGASFGGGGGDKPRGCFNCGEDGHRSSDCTQPKKERSNACFNCGEEGHRSSDCPNPRKERGGGAGGGCFNCGEEGHRSAECPNPRKEREGGGGGNCFNCRQPGHRSADCPEPQRERNDNCFNCGQPGHISSDCTEPRKEREDGAKPASTHVPEEVVVESLFSEHIVKGEMFERFFDSEVVITSGGKKVENICAVSSFAELGLGEGMMRNVTNSGYQKPTPIQKYAMPLISQGKDVMACSQTGSGKTAAFLLPIMARLLRDGNLSNMGESTCSPRVLILAPTRELAIQIFREATKFSANTIMKVEIVYGGTSVQYQKSKIQRGATIVVGTTGRMCHFIEEGLISVSEVLYLILDEADKMLDMGFHEDINRIVNNPNIRPKQERQTLMFSATFPPTVQELAAKLLRDDYAMIVVDKIGAANKCITQTFLKLTRGEKKRNLLDILNVDLKKYAVSKESEVFKQKTLVFVSSKKQADTLGTILNEAGLPCTTIHGDRDQKQREMALHDFRKGHTPVMIATAVAERGLDITGVDHVINYDMPKEVDEYVHRIGRTGRVGNSGNATSFFVPDDDSELATGLVNLLAQAEQIVPDWLEEMKGSGGGYSGGSFGGGGDAGAAADDCW